MKFKATVTETLSRTVKIEANNVDEAMQEIEKMYSNGDIVLTADDFMDSSTSFKVVALEK